jgi:hypothetical protein
MAKSSRDGGVRGLIAAAAAVFVLGGMGLVAWATASQRRAPQPPAVGVTASAPMKERSVGESTSAPPTAQPLGGGSANETEPTLPRSKPLTLDIPSIGVHSAMQTVGLAADGALEVPAPGPHYNEAAWYRHSPTPGSLGPAIVLGHVDSAVDGPSVFFRLGELRPGDRVSVTRADDSTAIFIVDEVHRYAKDNFPTQLVYGDIDHAGLRILTCGGAFDDSTGHYLDNVVVFASLEGLDA